MLGESYVGKVIAMRTLIKLTSPDNVTFEIYFTPPGEPERIADRVVFTRRK